jgi:hypothetical protein
MLCCMGLGLIADFIVNRGTGFAVDYENSGTENLIARYYPRNLLLGFIGSETERRPVMSKDNDMSGKPDKLPATGAMEVHFPNAFRIPQAPSSQDTWVEMSRYEDFSDWIESEIANLELEFETFVTFNSTKRFFGR